MAKSLRLQILNEIGRYVNRETSFDDFQEWFMATIWEESPKLNRATKNLIGMVQLRMGEFLQGHWTEREFREHMFAMLPNSIYRVVEIIETRSIVRITELRSPCWGPWSGSPLSTTL
jgi:hypothetical protein